MSDFPKLRTGAVAQYPARRQTLFQTQVVRFVDGTEQRFREYGGPRHAWVIALELLGDDEISAIGDFVESVAAGDGTFAFTDPWDGTVYPSCRLADDTFLSKHDEENRGRTSLTIVESGG